MCGLLFKKEDELSSSDDDEVRHNIWNDRLTYITHHATGYRIQQRLEDEELAKIWVHLPFCFGFFVHRDILFLSWSINV